MMQINSDDYVVIDKYAAGKFNWLGEVDTAEKRENLRLFSYEVSLVFISVGAYLVADKPAQGGTS
ncbi:hypothetical protein N5923_23445 [Erwiniaceae bacterium BAC15a-03b]|uniref:Uncharacterized protein n=1 Tax=Winslowiella arboricola TaxID=2978220 RepID=A0A9J6PVA6_9GAMM|nr:hypothetical protein [Winslowiella arboricola]MCU5775095.1 hypothetical protein [Winslowiella arboricola]MCU5780451.1 hypothetical protein [Winslowiella arboricola]